ncbi:MAG TPA: hypothetical protein VN948_12080 [Terriglobales bacterium]|nr:hypothetical protein [Terriglobales bacterium]
MAKLPFRGDPRVVKTVGETFADGSALELVTSASSGRPALLLRNADRRTIAPQIEYSGHIYQPPDLDEAMWRAIRFPHDTKSYGSTGKLLRRIRELFERHAGLTQPDSALMTAWAASSWFPDCLSSPPTLLIAGPDMEHAITLFRLLHCLCRRPVVLGDLNRTAFLSLASLGATLLVNQPGLSARIRDLWSTSNYRGVYVFGNGKVRSVASSKAVFLGMADARGEEGMHFALPPAHCDLSLLDEQQQSGIAEELQPQLLMYRLRNFDRVRNFSAREHGSTFVGTEVARNLAASVLGEAEIVEPIAPLLRCLEQDKIAQRGCDVHLAMIQVTWAPSHEEREITLARLTELSNAFLRCHGEILEYSAAEIGWKLRNFGFHRHRNGRGMVLKFSHEHRLLLHQLAARWSLNLRTVAGCALCSPREAVVAQRLV